MALIIFLSIVGRVPLFQLCSACMKITPGECVLRVTRESGECCQNLIFNTDITNILLLRLSITCGLQNSKLNRQMRFSLPSIKCSAAPPSFRLGCLNCTQQFDLIAVRSGVVGSWEQPPNHLIDGSEKRICRLSLNFRVRMLLKSAVINSVEYTVA